MHPANIFSHQVVAAAISTIYLFEFLIRCARLMYDVARAQDAKVLKFVNHALNVNNGRLVLFECEDLTNFIFLLWKTRLVETPILALRFCISLLPEFVDCRYLNDNGTVIKKGDGFVILFLGASMLSTS